MPDELHRLPPAARAARYRALEKLALKRAETATTEAIRKSYFGIAQGWASLAEQIEWRLKKPPRR